MHRYLLTMVGIIVLVAQPATAEIISCPTALTPAHRDCVVFKTPIGDLYEDQKPQRCAREDCRAALPTIGEDGRKVCLYQCFRHIY